VGTYAVYYTKHSPNKECDRKIICIKLFDEMCHRIIWLMWSVSSSINYRVLWVWVKHRIYIRDQQIMSHLSLFEKKHVSMSLYQSRLRMFSKKKYSEIQILNKWLWLSYSAISNLVIIAYYWIRLYLWIK
jgi:hypothetical protein